ncbi:hypothetical protein [Saccharothrix longispora]|uniref:hypothetical protein n=1 Tax=Saccharothrix longispora TaxID=33920 RepID=UPI0028FD7F9B|nr:hypothetical protein [Saccharothrix longispora]MBY8850513.1 hypothetical protein [Saccharothrix sp. MB29]MDU0292534.1 hypothetical protein [Saccharothrix longispora]
MAHAEAVRAARARVVVFPELSLTGYHFDAPVVSPDAPAPLVAACAETGEGFAPAAGRSAVRDPRGALVRSAGVEVDAVARAGVVPRPAGA